MTGTDATASARARNDAENVAVELRRKIMGFIVSQAIAAVTELGVPDRLADGPASADELARAVGADSGSLHRFLRALVAEGLFIEDGRGRFSLTPMGDLLRDDVPGSLHHFAGLMTAEAYRAWADPLYSARTGMPAFERVFGVPMFDWLTDHPRALARFNAGQAGLVHVRMEPLLDRDWSAVSTVVDVGGGNGALLLGLLRRYPHLEGVLFEMPHIAEAVRRGLGSTGLAGRVRCVGGDFRTTVPAGGDVYVLAQILHDWGDESAAVILRHCHRGMSEGGRLLILEQIVPEDNRPHPAKLLDLHMMVMLGGRERTISEWETLLTVSHFEITDIVKHSRSSLIEARPA